MGTITVETRHLTPNACTAAFVRFEFYPIDPLTDGLDPMSGASSRSEVGSRPALAIVVVCLAVISGCGGGGGEATDGTTGTPPDRPNVPPAMYSKTLTWFPPTTRSDGSPLTNLAGFRIHYWGTNPSNAGAHALVINNPSAITWTIDDLSADTWNFAMVTFDSDGHVSRYSNIVSTAVP